MSPILYIFLLTLVVALMLYWVISSLDTRKKNEEREEIDFHLETAQELFKYLEPEQETGDVLHLSSHPGYILAYWRINPKRWKQLEAKYGPNIGVNSLAIRLHESASSSNTFELPVEELDGTCYFKSNSQVSYYGIIGIQKEDNFIPLMLSNPVFSTDGAEAD
mgnify:FL=1